MWIKTQRGDLIEVHGHLYLKKDDYRDAWLVKDKQDNIYYEAKTQEEGGRIIDTIFTCLKRNESLDLQAMVANPEAIDPFFSRNTNK